MLRNVAKLLLTFAKEATKGITELIFPDFCLGCGLRGELVCDNCLKEIKPINNPCQLCGAPQEGPICYYCRDLNLSFDGARAGGLYEGILRELILALKFRGRADIGEKIWQLMVKALPSYWQIDLVLAVPPHRNSLSERVFSSSVLLGAGVSHLLSLPFHHSILRWKKEVVRQVGLGRMERFRNVRGAIEVISKEEIRDKKILIVDDVMTTGATASACAEALKRAKAKRVWVLTAARDITLK
ncbi:ComF family protein [bacterium]|nr:ComF family protein [bacterium]